MKQKLTHWTDKKFKEKMINGNGEFRPTSVPSKFKENIKPIGFWLSVDNSWERWLKGNWDSWLKEKICLNVELSKDIKLFVIKGKKQFLEEFKKVTGKDYMRLGIGKWMLQKFHKKLRKKYDGIYLLSEPFYRHRLDDGFMYFYPWDCESIYVWNKKKIKFIEDMEK